MKDTQAQIEKLRKHLKELTELRREEIRAARAARPKKKPGRKPISPAILNRALQLAEKMTLTDVALRCDVALKTLYNYGISRKTINKNRVKN
jgi:cell division septum initiation protein DivIVA